MDVNNVDKIFSISSETEQDNENKIDDLRYLLHYICNKSSKRIFEFEIDKGRYIRVPEVGLAEEISEPLTGKTFIFSPEENNKYLVLSLDDLSKIVNLYKSVVEELHEIQEGSAKHD